MGGVNLQSNYGNDPRKNKVQAPKLNDKIIRSSVGRASQLLVGRVLSSDTSRIENYDSVAQLVEQYTFNVWVLGSNPSGIT